MAETGGGASPHRSAPLDTGTRLSYERTFLAHERTQMAWVRTGLALISFGFGIAKFFQYIQQNQGDEGPVFGPKTVGMIMIAIGLVSLALANGQHYRAMRSLRKECPGLPSSTAGMTAVIVMMLGIIAFLGALL